MRSLYTTFTSNILFPLHERLKGHDTVKVRKEMECTQWWNSKELQALQVSRLKKLLLHASQEVPYYRDLFLATGFSPGSVNSIEELQHLPFLTKSLIRQNTEALKAEKAVDLARFNTGGSSGEPLVFFIGKERVSHDVAAKWRATRWWGVDIGDPEIVIWGSPIEVGAQDRMRGVRDGLLRSQLLPAFEMSGAKLDSFIATIRRVRPKMLFGYPSALSHIALHAKDKGQQMDDLGIKVAFVTSERLYDHQRQSIETVFGCKVANGYGGRDAGFIAHECPAGGMHITAEDVIVEIIGKDDRPVPVGEAGEIVVTHLATKDFPFIRYRTDDVGVLGDKPCSCGRGLPLLTELQGRSTDFLVAADGTVMHGLALIYILRDLPGIKSFKIVQESLSLTRVLIVPEQALDVDTRLKIENGFKARLGQSVDVMVEVVSEIPAERSGKYRYVISRVAV